MQVTVVGAGVVGLTVAVRLAKDGHDVQVLTDRAPTETTSSVAAALWYPYLAAPADRTRAWGARTYEVLRGLARSAPEAGVDLRHGREVLRRAAPAPSWHEDVDDFVQLGEGWAFTAPVADMSVYLPWLAQLAESHGVRTGHARLDRSALSDLRGDAVVLCPGLGASTLLGDPSLTPVRGQVVLLEQTGVEQWVLAEPDDPDGDPTYVVPRRSVVVCGGTARPGREDLDPEPTTTSAILRRCRTLVPELASARVVAQQVGLRPVRPQVRLELDDTGTHAPAPVVHCYGHGGAGVTLSWGCAEEVTSIVRGLG